jgi:hypothetical protein
MKEWEVKAEYMSIYERLNATNEWIRNLKSIKVSSCKEGCLWVSDAVGVKIDR